METIRNYTVHSSNGSSKQKSSVTIRNQYGQRVARLYSDTGRLLQRIRTDMHAPERAEIVAMLASAGVPEDDILALLTPNNNKV